MHMTVKLTQFSSIDAEILQQKPKSGEVVTKFDQRKIITPFVTF